MKLARLLVPLVLAASAIVATPVAAQAAGGCSSPCDIQVQLTVGPTAATLMVHTTAPTTIGAAMAPTSTLHDPDTGVPYFAGYSMQTDDNGLVSRDHSLA